MGFSLTQIAGALIKGSKWKNAYKRKRLISKVKCSLILKMSRRRAIVRQSQFDVAQLIQIGLHDIALSRVEQLYRDQCMVSAYAQLDQFCDFIYSNLDTMSKRSSDLSVDAREAVSSLIYAASRCGDVPELHCMRNLFKQLFGQDFERTCVDLLPGNNVNPQIKHYLSRKLVVPEDVKLQLMNDIAKEITLYLGTSQTSGQNIVPEYNEMNASSTSYSSNVYAAALPAQNESQIQPGALDSWAGNVNPKRRGCATSRNYLEPQEISFTKSHGLKNSSEFVAESHKSANDLNPHLSHVHPKLPDYDDLVVKFTDMKKNCMQKNSNRGLLGKLILKASESYSTAWR